MLAYYLDEDAMDNELIEAMRRRGLDVVTPNEAGTIHRLDDEHLAFAKQASRVLYSFNVSDFSRLHAEWLSAGRPHAGILLAHQWRRHSIGDRLRGLLRLASQLGRTEMQNRLEYLRDWI